MSSHTPKPYPFNDALPPRVEEAAVLSYLGGTTVTVSSIDLLRETVQLNDATIADWLNVSVKTLRNYKNHETALKDYVQEKVVLLLALFNHGKTVFGSFDSFSTWLQTENFFFDGKAPASFLNTFSGAMFIDDRLTALEYGDNV